METLVQVLFNQSRSRDGQQEKEKTLIGVVPSQVVCNYSNRNEGTYVKDMILLIDTLQNEGHQVILLPHSIQVDKPAKFIQIDDFWL